MPKGFVYSIYPRGNLCSSILLASTCSNLQSSQVRDYVWACDQGHKRKLSRLGSRDHAMCIPSLGSGSESCVLINTFRYTRNDMQLYLSTCAYIYVQLRIFFLPIYTGIRISARGWILSRVRICTYMPLVKS